MKIYQPKPTTKKLRKDKRKRFRNIKHDNSTSDTTIPQEPFPVDPKPSESSIDFNKIALFPNQIEKRSPRRNFSNKSTLEFESMQGKEKTIKFHSSPNTEDVNVDIVTGTNKQENEFIDYKRCEVLRSEPSFNVNFVDLSNKDKVNVTLVQKYSVAEPEVVKDKTVRNEVNTGGHKKLLRLYQENSQLKGYESSVDVRYVVENEPKKEIPFIKKLIMKLFGKDD